MVDDMAEAVWSMIWQGCMVSDDVCARGCMDGDEEVSGLWCCLIKHYVRNSRKHDC